MKNPESGYDPLLEERMRAVLPLCAAKGIKIVTSMGALTRKRRRARPPTSRGRSDSSALKVAAIVGGDVLDACKDGDLPIMEFDGTIRQLGNRLLSANAYLGAEPMAQALAAGADIVITGRASDPALFLAPMIHAFGWAMDDWNLLGQGPSPGICWSAPARSPAGYFADPGYKDVAGLARLGFRSARSARMAARRHQGCGLGRRGDGADLQGAVARGARPCEIFPAGRGRGFLAGESRGNRTRSGSCQRRARRDAARYAEGLGRLCRQLHRRGADLLCRPRRAGAGTAGAARSCRERLKLTGVAASELRFELVGVDSPHGRKSRARWRTRPTRCACAWPADAENLREARQDRQRGRDALYQRPGGGRRCVEIGARRRGGGFASCCRANWQSRRSGFVGR